MALRWEVISILDCSIPCKYRKKSAECFKVWQFDKFSLTKTFLTLTLELGLELLKPIPQAKKEIAGFAFRRPRIVCLNRA